MNRPLLSVVSPAFNEAGTIVKAIEVLVDYLERIGLDYEIVVVSDGSTDETFLQASRSAGPRVRVIHYGRNMGKGYALRTGSKVARGEWIAWFDADLDLQPDALGGFLDLAQTDGLDVVIGSKRHPDSDVIYPRYRRVYSWLYQQLVRAMFRLNVRDTQVGVKLFRREVLDAVLPVVLVKRYAFDLEVLAVSRRFGFGAIVEQPVALHYRFTGSGINWRAIVNALIDTVAIFYRLRILHFYDRKRQLARRVAAHSNLPSLTLTVVIAASEPHSKLGYVTSADVGDLGDTPDQMLVVPRDFDGCANRASDWLRAVLDRSTSEAIAFLGPGMRVSHGWADAGLALLRDPSVAVVVGPTVPLLSGHDRHDAAAILSESRFGVGGARVRHHVGSILEVEEFPTRNLFIRRDDLIGAVEAGVTSIDDLCRTVRSLPGRTVLCSPDVIALSAGSPLFAPYLGYLWRLGRARSGQLGRARRVRLRYIIPALLVVVLLGAIPALLTGGLVAVIAVTIISFYLFSVVGFALLIGVLHRRGRLAILAAAGAVASHITFGGALLAGTASRLRRRPTRLVKPGEFPGTPGHK